MKIIIDVNPLTALLKNSTLRSIIANFRRDFYFPEPSLHKIRKYKKYILKKSGFSEQEFTSILNSIMKFIKIIPTKEILQHWNEAKRIMEKIDPEDVTIMAAALSQKGSVIWSDDKHFNKQDKASILKTKDMIELVDFKIH